MLSLQTRRQLQDILPPARGTTAATTLAARILAGLLAIPALEEIVRHVQRCRFQPTVRERVFKDRNGEANLQHGGPNLLVTPI